MREISLEGIEKFIIDMPQYEEYKVPPRVVDSDVSRSEKDMASCFLLALKT